MTTPTSFPHDKPKPFQSKLKPVAQVIRELRRIRKSYREIAQILRNEHGIAVNRKTIWNFVKVRSNPRPVIAMADDPTPAATKSGIRSVDAIAALKAKPAPAVKKPPYTYDENHPLTMEPKES